MPRYSIIAFILLSVLGAAPAIAAAADKVVKVAPGYVHGCALTAAGNIYCWGMERVNGGTANTTVAHRVDGLPKANGLASGHVNSCALDAEGLAWCWGVDLQASVAAKRAILSGPKHVTGLAPASLIASGYLHTCAITGLERSVWCWGANTAGELGDGSTTDRAEPVRAGSIAHATSLSAGINNSCATVMGGDVFCWGTDLQTGNGQIVGSKVPLRVSLDQPVIKIVNGRNFFCGLTGDKGVVCFGSNILNQLGNKALGKVYGKTSPRNLTGVSDIGAGGFFGCALLPDGHVRCWGHTPAMEQLVFEGSDPEQVPEIAGATGLGVGLATACAVDTAGRTLCWGNNQTGQTGNGRTSAIELVPVEVQGLPGGHTLPLASTGASSASMTNRAQPELPSANKAFASPPGNGAVGQANALSKLFAGAMSPGWWKDFVTRRHKAWPH